MSRNALRILSYFVFILCISIASAAAPDRARPTVSADARAAITNTVWQLVLIGPPGAGKTTIAAKLQEALGIARISAGNLVRDAGRESTLIGRTIRDLSSKGDLVPDEIMMEILSGKLKADQCRRGFVLDGFPRTLDQARRFDKFLKGSCPGTLRVIFLDIPEKVSHDRVLRRGREDDTENVFRHRFTLYRDTIAAVTDHYARYDQLLRIDANRPVDVVFLDILARLGLRDRPTPATPAPVTAAAPTSAPSADGIDLGDAPLIPLVGGAEAPRVTAAPPRASAPTVPRTVPRYRRATGRTPPSTPRPPAPPTTTAPTPTADTGDLIPVTESDADAPAEPPPPAPTDPAPPVAPDTPDEPLIPVDAGSGDGDEVTETGSGSGPTPTTDDGSVPPGDGSIPPLVDEPTVPEPANPTGAIEKAREAQSYTNGQDGAPGSGDHGGDAGEP